MILVTLFGIVMLLKPVHLEKAPSPIIVTRLPSMVIGMISFPETAVSQSVIVTEFPFLL